MAKKKRYSKGSDPFQRKKPSPRKFGNKQYKPDTRHTSKSSANKRAENLRGRGEKARVVKSGTSYLVYYRK